MNLIQITTTSDDKLELEQIAATLVERGLAACCQIRGPITSIYRWKDKTESSQEWTCSIKTRKQLFSTVTAVIKDAHHYEVPQITAVEICNVSHSYLEWVCSVTNTDE